MTRQTKYTDMIERSTIRSVRGQNLTGSDALDISKKDFPSSAKREVHSISLPAGVFCFELAYENAEDPGEFEYAIKIEPEIATSDCILGGFRLDGWLFEKDDLTILRVKTGSQKIYIHLYGTNFKKDQCIPLRIYRINSTLKENNNKIKNLPWKTIAGLQVDFDLLVHVEGSGDTVGRFGEWLGDFQGRRCIEGFMIKPQNVDFLFGVEYSAVLGSTWISPNFKAGEFCGSRGLSLPLLGFKIILPQYCAHELIYYAKFTNGKEIGPLKSGEYCTSGHDLSSLSAIKIEVIPPRAERDSRGNSQGP